ncbi:MAG: hypothetical protein JST00_17455 [Deltaproteobacteria bacterium]|nr:hypothetical protein [Deltaproteobacteria bacterium]
MAGPAFEPNGAVRFDLKNGAASDSKGGRLVLVPSAVLAGLDPATLAHIGDALGRACGARIASRLGGDNGVRATNLEVVVTHLAGELAIAGVGAVHLERWGRAMVAVVQNPGVADDAFVGAVLAGALSAASGRDLSAAPLGKDGGRSRYFLGGAATAARASALASQGKGFADVLASIQAKEGSS